MGSTSGGGCGLLFGFIPIAVNGRTERAYRQAVKDGGGTGVPDTTLTDSWYWTPIGTLLCTRIEGTAIRDAAPGTAVSVPR